MEALCGCPTAPGMRTPLPASVTSLDTFYDYLYEKEFPEPNFMGDPLGAPPRVGPTQFADHRDRAGRELIR